MYAWWRLLGFLVVGVGCLGFLVVEVGCLGFWQFGSVVGLGGWVQPDMAGGWARYIYSLAYQGIPVRHEKSRYREKY